MNKSTHQIATDKISLTGDLVFPDTTQGIIIFAHGSGSGRLSPRNQSVAQTLNEAGFATLLFDLLSEAESLITENRFDIALLTARLQAATQWAANMDGIKGLPIGYFGASTGAASALKAAAALGDQIKAVVSRGGRPDLALEALPQVKSAVQLIVGARDYEVITMNQDAFARIIAPKEMVIIKGASHLFEEQGTLEEVAEHAKRWFAQYLKI
jgi:putative phosphoribosyl transferase